MKITKEQIDALVSNEISKNNKERLEELNTFKNLSSTKSEIKRILNEYKVISPALKGILGYNIISENCILSFLIRNYKYKIPQLINSELKNKITIATIEAKDLTELKKILKLS